MDRRPASGVQHELRADGYTAVIASVGASLRTLTFEGRDLVVPFDADEIRPNYRGATLVPWPNRVVDGRYVLDDVEHRLALTEPSRGHALHGLGSWLHYDAVEVREDSVELSAVIEPQEGYPWRVGIRTIFVLGRDGLTQSVTATNLSSRPAPYGTGPHPYLVAGRGIVDDWTLHLPASTVTLTDGDRLLPGESVDVAVDAERFDFRTPRVIGDARIDHAFTALERDAAGRATVRLTAAAGTGVMLSWGEECPWLQIHTADRPGEPADRVGLAVEPMTCAPDAFNNGEGLITLAPGGRHTASWTISAFAESD